MIKFTDPDDITAFGMCDIRENIDSCPVDPESPIGSNPTDKLLYSKVNKKKTSQEKTSCSNAEQTPSKATNNDNEKKKKKKSSKPKPSLFHIDGTDEAAIYV